MRKSKLALGQKDAARHYLGTMKRQAIDGDALALMEVYEAWLTVLDGNPDDGIKRLEAILAKNEQDLPTAEAADILAMLYMARGDKPAAKRSVDYGLKSIKYANLMTDYTEKLLRNRLKSNITSPEAEKAYRAAEALRLQRKFVEANQAFVQLRKQYPHTEWAHAAGFRLGQCMVGLNRTPQAIEHWAAFVIDSPDRPWRGQARVAIFDTVLETTLDLKTASEHAMAATARLAKSRGPADGSSWNDAAYDIHLRHGMASLVEERFDAAVTAFQHARESIPKPTASRSGDATQIEHLDRLIEVAQKREPLVPRELTHGDASAVVAVSLGSVQNVLHRYEAAQKFFRVPLTGRSASSSSAHRSFAALGLARATAGLGRLAKSEPPTSKAPSPKSRQGLAIQGKALYQQAVEEHRAGSWNAETLQEVGLLIEHMAAEQHVAAMENLGKLAAVRDDGKINQGNKHAFDRVAFERDRLTATLRAVRAEALPYWADLPKRHADSPHVPQALYHSGILYSEAEAPDESLAAFEQLVVRYPDSPWTGDAHVRLIDVKLEQDFDLTGAQRLAAAAVKWYEQREHLQGSSPLALPITSDDSGLPTPEEVGYDIYLRAGLVEYVSNPNGTAAAFFEKAKPLQPRRDLDVQQGSIATGVERLIALAKTGKVLTPDAVLRGDAKAKLVLMLADIYHAAEQWDRAMRLCGRIVDGMVPRASDEQKSYAHFRRGRTRYAMGGDDFGPELAFADYAAAIRQEPSAEWAAKAVYLCGNIQWNHVHDADAAIATWTTLIRTYPKCEDIDRSAYLIGVLYEWTDRPSQAIQAFDKFLKAYPGSRFASAAVQKKGNLAAREKSENGLYPARLAMRCFLSGGNLGECVVSHG